MDVEFVTDSHALASTLDRVVELPPAGPGFVGEGHTAVLAIDARDFARHDPFIFLADDRLDLPVRILQLWVTTPSA